MDMIHTSNFDFAVEMEEWLAYFQETLSECSTQEATQMLQALQKVAARHKLPFSFKAFSTPYKNTLPAEQSEIYPGDLDIEHRIENIIRWNACAMVSQGVDKDLFLGGHISTFAAAATMLEVGFNHHFRKGDLVFIQGHASPGIYARAALEGRLSWAQLAQFRQELHGGLASYPHPRRHPDFWECPSVSMGLGASFAVGQSRFWKYLENRGLAPKNGNKVWCYIGDGELDEPEIMGSALVAGRDCLDNLIFVVNCNLQRLDGPVRGNGKIMQDMEAAFAGLGFEVIKVVWSSAWDFLLEQDLTGALQRRLDALPDGEFQRMPNMTGGEIRNLLKTDLTVQDHSEIARLLDTLPDERLKNLFVGGRGGNDRRKIHDAYVQARSANRPVAILIKTTKGYGLGNTAGSNETHQKKDLSSTERKAYAEWLNIPLSPEQAEKAEFYIPDREAEEVQYLLKCRQQLGGFIPERRISSEAIIAEPDAAIFADFDKGNTKGRNTTQDFVKLLKNLALDPVVGRQIVPIVPDEAQTFGMHEFFTHPKIGVFNPHGQQYQAQIIGTNPYLEKLDGQLMQEGINECGALASFTAAATSDAVRGVVTVPFYLFYSQFGFQRVLDSIWAAADMLGRGFLMGGIAGRTTLNGEGLQHADGGSLVLAATVPSIVAYDPGFSFELASIIKTGWKRMYVEDERIIFYLTLYNENYAMPDRPSNIPDQDIAQGIYKFKNTSLTNEAPDLKAHLIGSGSILPQAIQAAELLESLGIPTDIWSATSWCELLREAQGIERHNRLNPGKTPEKPLVYRLFSEEKGVVVVASDFMKLLPQTVAASIPLPVTILGTEGFGLSESRAALRDWFEVSAAHIAHAALVGLCQKGFVPLETVLQFADKHQTRVSSNQD